MKRVFAMLALLGAVAFGAPAWADDKVAPAASATATAPAGMAGMSGTAAEAAPVAAPVIPPNKGDNAWVMVSAALVILCLLYTSPSPRD